jgi:hypothetical protein
MEIADPSRWSRGGSGNERDDGSRRIGGVRCAAADVKVAEDGHG